MRVLEYLINRPFGLGVMLAFMLGAGLAWAMPPTHIILAPFFVLPLYFVVLRSTKTLGGTALTGWAFGFGFHVLGLHWIANALLVADNPYGWAYPLALIGLPALLALFDMVAATLIKLSGGFNHVSSVVRFAGILAAFEMIRGYAFTGFPWNLLGYAWSDHLPMLQITSLVGIYGLSALTYLVASLPALALIGDLKNSARIAGIGAGIVLLGGVYTYGAVRLDQSPTVTHDGRHIVLIQPNIPQSEKWDTEKYDDHLRLHLGLSRPLPSASMTPEAQTLILWAEASIPAEYVTYSEFQQAIHDTLHHYRGAVYLAAGAIRRVDNGFANSVMVYDKNGAIIASYDKHHLVPFGEYIPLQDHIPLAPIARFQGLIKGPGPMNVMAGPLTLSPLVCYEGIFPGAAIDRSAPRPDLLVSVTNDAWYGATAGPYQHFAQTRVRAIEEGIPLARAAQTGLSGVVDSYGRVMIKTELFTQSRITTDWPEKIVQPTLYAEVGNHPVIVLIVLMILVGVRLPRRNPQTPDQRDAVNG